LRPMLIAALLGLLAPCSGAAQAGDSTRWRWVNSADELSDRTDSRLILKGMEPGPLLLFVCGDRLPGDSARTLLFFAGESLLPFGGGADAYVEVRFANEQVWRPGYWRIYEAGEPQTELPLTGMSRRVAFMGSGHTPYFSTELFKRLVASDTVSIRYRVFGDSHEVRFLTAGLAATLGSRTDCRWPMR
jgi:hypothetical protein